MNRSIRQVFALLTIAGCEEVGGTGDTGSTPTEEAAPEPTERGEPVGRPVTATIGAEGGALTTRDGRFTVAVPPGALDHDTEIGIQPITNLAWGGIGDAYRLTPEDVDFAQPLTLSLAYGDVDLVGTAAEFLRLFTQDDDGYWAYEPDGLRGGSRGVVITVPHGKVRDVALGTQLRLSPGAARVPLNQELPLVVENCVPWLEKDPAFAAEDFQSHPCGEWITIGGNETWWVEGVKGGAGPYGTVEDHNDPGEIGFLAVATYRAPNKLPDLAEVAVGVDFVEQGQKVTLSMLVTLADRWVGTTTLTGPEFSVKTDIAFDALPPLVIDGKTIIAYLPTGTANLLKLTTPGCVSATPNDTRKISGISPKGTGSLSIDTAAETYLANGLVLWDVVCNGTKTVVPTVWIGDPKHADRYIGFDAASGRIQKTVQTSQGSLSWDLKRE